MIKKYFTNRNKFSTDEGYTYSFTDDNGENHTIMFTDENTNVKSVNTEYDNSGSEEDSYEMVNHPSHYNNYDVEVIEMMKKIWGVIATYNFCQMNAFKYRMRMGTKPGNDILQDLDKEKWYLEQAHILKEEIKSRGTYNPTCY